MKQMEISFGEGTTYVSLVYGESTDYCPQVHGIGNSRINVVPGAPPEDCTVAVTNMERALSLPDLTGMGDLL
jgi:hypothetical protein